MLGEHEETGLEEGAHESMAVVAWQSAIADIVAASSPRAETEEHIVVVEALDMVGTAGAHAIAAYHMASVQDGHSIAVDADTQHMDCVAQESAEVHVVGTDGTLDVVSNEAALVQ